MRFSATILLYQSNKGGSSQNHAPAYEIYIKFNDALGVTRDTPVRKAGIRIGHVRDVRFADDDIGVIVTAEIDRDRQLYNNEECMVTAPLLMGDALLEFVRIPNFQGEKVQIENGAILQGQMVSEMTGSLAGLQKQAVKTLTELDTLGHDLHNMVTRADTQLAKVDETMQLLQKTLTASNDLLGDPVLRGQIKRTITEMPAVLEETRGTVKRIEGTFASLEHNMQNTESVTKPLGERGPGLVDEFDASMKKLNLWNDNILRFSQELNDPQGSLIPRLFGVPSRELLPPLREIGVPANRGATANCVKFSPDGTKLAFDLANKDHTIALWDINTGQECTEFKGHGATVHAIVFSPDGSRLVSASEDKTLRVWNASTGRELFALDGHSSAVRGKGVFANGTRIISAGDDGAVLVWDATALTQLSSLKLAFSSPMTAVAFSPDGSLVVTGHQDAGIRIWEVTNGRLRHESQEHAGAITSIAFSLDGHRVASGALDDTIKIWTLTRERDCLRFAATLLEFPLSNSAPTGSCSSRGSWDSTIKLWDVVTGQELGGLRHHATAICAVAFSPDGRLLGSVSADRAVRLWVVQPPARPGVLRTAPANMPLEPGPLNGPAITRPGPVFLPAERANSQPETPIPGQLQISPGMEVPSGEVPQQMRPPGPAARRHRIPPRHPKSRHQR